MAARSVWVARLQENCRKKTDRAVVQPSFATEEMQSGSQGRDRGIHVPMHLVSTRPVKEKKGLRDNERLS